MKKILLLIISLMLCTMALAAPEYYFKQSNTIDIKIPCVTNTGASCSGSATCNITIQYPNTSTMIKEGLMQNQGTFHNYTTSDTETLGEYECTVFCIDGSNTGYNSFSYVINSTGEEDNANSILIVYIVLIGSIFVYLISSFLIDKIHIIPKLVTFFMAFTNTIVALLMVYIERVAAHLTDKMLLYLFEGNIFVLFILIAYYFIYLVKKSSPMGDEKDDYL